MLVDALGLHGLMYKQVQTQTELAPAVCPIQLMSSGRTVSSFKKLAAGQCASRRQDGAGALSH